jgi:hypothetical protein
MNHRRISLGCITIAAAVLAFASHVASRAEDPGKSTAASGEDSQHDRLEITPPFALFEDDSIEPEGHQPWRANESMMAAAEIRNYVPSFLEVDETPAALEESFEVLSRGKDSMERPTVVLRWIPGRRWSRFRSGAVEVHLTQSAGEVWFATRIVIYDADPAVTDKKR